MSLVSSILCSVIGGLGIFLLGMKNMSEGLQTVAGEKLRHLIGMVTNKRLMAVGIGTLVTSIIQSSSVTTVMVVGFVNSGIMTLRQAIGVIMGANIGTTITGWILVLSVEKLGLPMLGIAAFVFLFSKKEKIKYGGLAIMGIGMVFFGLELMKNGLGPIGTMPDFVSWFQMFSADTYFGVIKCVLVGCAITLIVQSSSATVGITMGLASTGIIHFETAAALVLGENIGTTITAYLASLGTTTNARRAAYAHIVFNVTGVLWITTIFGFYMFVIRKFLGVDPNFILPVDGKNTYPYIQAGIAAVHSGFNIVNTLVFLPLVPLLAKLLTKFVPDKPHKEPPKLTHLDVRMLETPMVGIEQSKKEILVMGIQDKKIFEHVKTCLGNGIPDQQLIQRVFKKEEIQDTLQKEITIFLTEVLSGNVPHSISQEARLHIYLASELESISDHLKLILKLYMKVAKSETVFPEEMRSELVALHEKIEKYFSDTFGYFEADQIAPLPKTRADDAIILDTHRELRDKYLTRLSKTQLAPLLNTTYADILSCYKRITDHVFNIAETLSQEK